MKENRLISSDEASFVLEEIANYLEFKNENPFKVRAFQNAARILKGFSGSLRELLAGEALKQSKGIGAGILEKLTDLAEHGQSHYLDELRQGTPRGLEEMLRIPGLGPKKIRVLYDKLRIQTLEQLETACKEGKVAALKGFGEKTAENILHGLAFLKQHKDRHLFSKVYPEAKEIEERLRALPEVQEVSIGGSLRRHLETVKDIDLVAATDASEKVMTFFTTMPNVESVTARGETKAAVVLENGLRADLRMVSLKEFPYALHHFTGSKEHNTAMRTRAKAMGFKMNEYGLFKGEKSIPCKNEEEIFSRLGLHYIPPELRENHGEIEAAETDDFRDLIDYDDLRGVFHVHTTYSDGKNSLEEMVQEAVRRGYAYLGITDHSQSAQYANGLKPDRLRRQADEINCLREKYPQIAIFHGIESDILKGGELDYKEKDLERLDFVIASVHAQFTLPEKEMTTRIIRALENPYCTMLGHPTGRLLLSREPYAVNMEGVIDAAARNKKIIELNCNPWRFDLDWRLGALARKWKIKTSINPDAHRQRDFDYLFYGIGIARKAGFRKKEVINSYPLAKIKEILKGA